MGWNFVVLSMFEIFIFNPNQKREKINKDRKKNYAKFSKSYKVLIILFLLIFVFKFWRGLGACFCFFWSIFFCHAFTSYTGPRSELYPSPLSSHGPCPSQYNFTPSHPSPIPWEPFSFKKLPVSKVKPEGMVRRDGGYEQSPLRY